MLYETMKAMFIRSKKRVFGALVRGCFYVKSEGATLKASQWRTNSFILLFVARC